VLVASRIFVLIIVALFVGLPPAAFADPPDPTWIGGYWDDDDFDNVVDAITTATAFKAPARPAVELPILVLVAHVVPAKRHGWRVPLRAAAPPRASTARLTAELPLGSPATFLGRDVGDAPAFAVCLQDGRTCAGRDQRRKTLENATPQGKVVA